MPGLVPGIHVFEYLRMKDVDGRDEPRAMTGMTTHMTSRTATLIGLTAILMWSLLAVLTVATGKIPAFQLAAMTFAIGAAVGFAELGSGGPRRSARCGSRRSPGSSGSAGCSAITRCISWRCASRRRPKRAC